MRMTETFRKSGIQPNIRIYRIEDRSETKSNSLDNLFSEIIADNFPNIETEIYIQIERTF